VAERIDFDHHTPADRSPPAALAARSGIDWGLEQHLYRLGYWRLPVTDWDPAPEPDSERECQQLAAMWGRIGDAVKTALRRDQSVGVTYVVAATDLAGADVIEWADAVTEIAPRLHRCGGTFWLCAAEAPRSAERGAQTMPLLALDNGRAFGAAICWWDDDQLRIASLGANEPAVMPFIPLPVVTIGPAGLALGGPEVHDILVSWPGRELRAVHDLQQADSRAERMCALACRLSLLALSLLDKLQAEQRAPGTELGPPPTPFRDPAPYLPVRPRLITDTRELADTIVEIWRQHTTLGLQKWEVLDRIHHEPFADRDLTPVDSAAVEQAHWGIYAAGSNIDSPNS
jgi:hypothetical protein